MFIVAQRCSVKKVFLEILQKSKENNRARVSFLIKLQAKLTSFKKRLRQRRFPENFAKFLRTLFYRTPPVVASVQMYFANSEADYLLIQSKTFCLNRMMYFWYLFSV